MTITPCATACACWACGTGRAGSWSTSRGELRELPGAEECCGFGGTFAIKNAAVSAAMGADKVRGIRGTGAEAVGAVDNSHPPISGPSATRRTAPPRRMSGGALSAR